jgi:5-methylcytosine-specific restriction enzyme subunit McrC
MAELIETSEYELFDVSADAISAADIEVLTAEKIFAISRSLSASHFQFASMGWVGQFPISESITVRVAPKVPVTSLLWMLDVAYRLEFKIWDQALTQVTSIEDTYASFASVLSKRVIDRLRQGIYRTYVDHAEGLQLVRGRVDIRGSATRLKASTELMCEYQEHTADIVENQILLFTLDLVSRTRIRDKSVAARVRLARNALLNEVTLRNVRVAECVGRRYDRLNDDYRFLHALCRFFIEHCAPSLSRGEKDALPFAIHMPRLFESFVAGWLSAHSPSHLDFRPQHRLKLNSNLDVALDLDLLVRDKRTGMNVAVLDTKYKNTDRPSREDIAQVVLYALQAGVRNAFLIYPSKVSMPFSAMVHGISIRSVALDLGGDCRRNSDAFARELVAALS